MRFTFKLCKEYNHVKKSKNEDIIPRAISSDTLFIQILES